MARFLVYRYQAGSAPHLQEYQLKVEPGMMVLDALLRLRDQDDTLTFRSSCQEGLCGSDGLNVNGRNCLACVTSLQGLSEPITIRPLPALPVIRDLIVDLTGFYEHYRAIKPYLISLDPPPERERLQTPAERELLDGLYECLLCGCCSSACPSFWWNPERFRGPAALLQAYRFIADSRDHTQSERLAALDDPYTLFRCHTIMSCMEVCPRDLNPSRAIAKLKALLLERSV